MKIKSILPLVVLLSFFTACKNDKVKDAPESDQPVEEGFKITLNATVEKKDDFQVFFQEDTENTPFEEDNSVYVGTVASAQPQDIVFRIPANVFPTRLRLDLGLNKEQRPIIIHNLKIEFQGKTFAAPGKDFFNYFHPDENFVKADTTNITLTPFLTKDGNYDPMLFSTEPLNNELAKLAN